MVRFEEDKLVIEIKASGRIDAMCQWIDIHEALCDAIYFIKSDTIIEETYFNIPLLLKELMPPHEELKKMVN